MTRFKRVLMGRFVVCVGCIVCGGKGRDIVSFLTPKRMTVKRYIHW